MDHTEIFETLREFYETSMLRLQFLYGNRDYVLQLREKFEVQAGSNNNPEGQLRLYFDPWLCHEEEFQSRTKARRI